MGKAMIYEVEEIYNDGAYENFFTYETDSETEYAVREIARKVIEGTCGYNLETEFDSNRVRIYDDNGDMVAKFTVDLNTCNVEWGI